MTNISICKKIFWIFICVVFLSVIVAFLILCIPRRINSSAVIIDNVCYYENTVTFDYTLTHTGFRYIFYSYEVDNENVFLEFYGSFLPLGGIFYESDTVINNITEFKELIIR